jgi:RNA polymerase sigma-70 factor (TIGR02943 family)
MPESIKQSPSSEIFRQWVEIYSDEMYSWAFHKTGIREVAEDIVQETFLGAFQSLKNFEGKSNVKTWLFGILNHKIMDYHRVRFRKSEAIASGKNNESGIYSAFDESGNWNSGHRPEPWSQEDANLLDNPEFNAALEKCMAKLPESWGAAVQLKYLDERKGEEICQELGVSPTNFWQILHRAKVQLRKCLESGWFNTNKK